MKKLLNMLVKVTCTKELTVREDQRHDVQRLARELVGAAVYDRKGKLICFATEVVVTEKPDA